MSKKVISFMVAAVMAMGAFALVGCGKSQADMVGTYGFAAVSTNQDTDEAQSDASMLSVFLTDAKIVLNEDGTLTYTYLDVQHDGTWTVDGSKIEVDVPDDTDGSLMVSGSYDIIDDGNKIVHEGTTGRLEGFGATWEKQAIGE